MVGFIVMGDGLLPCVVWILQKFEKREGSRNYMCLHKYSTCLLKRSQSLSGPIPDRHNSLPRLNHAGHKGNKTDKMQVRDTTTG